MNQAIQERLNAIEDQLREQAQKNIEEAQELEFDERVEQLRDKAEEAIEEAQELEFDGRVEQEYERLRDKAEQAIEDEIAEEAADNEEE